MAKSFAQQVQEMNQRALQKINKQCLSITFRWFQTCVMLTPTKPDAEYAKGALINNWFPQIGSGFSTETSSALSMTGSASLSRINSLITNSTEFLGKDGSITMANNLPYAYRAEYEGWPSPQWSGNVGPYRMVQRSKDIVTATPHVIAI